MKPVGFNKFVWPSVEDVTEVGKHGVLTTISVPPFPAARRYYSFPHDIATAITDKMYTYLKKH